MILREENQITQKTNSPSATLFTTIADPVATQSEAQALIAWTLRLVLNPT
jgi:hypothetical protein